MEWLWISGAVTRPGPAVVWMRPHTRLVPDEELSPLQRLLACVDSASGASAALDVAEWNFMNTELTVHVVRPPVGEWLCLHADTTLGPGSVGVAASEVYDERGLVARSAQALLVTPGSRTPAAGAHCPHVPPLPHRCNAGKWVSLGPVKPSASGPSQSWIRANGWASSSS